MSARQKQDTVIHILSPDNNRIQLHGKTACGQMKTDTIIYTLSLDDNRIQLYVLKLCTDNRQTEPGL